MNNPNQNYNHSEPRQEKDQFRHTAQVPITVPKYRVTIEHGSIGRSRERPIDPCSIVTRYFGTVIGTCAVCLNWSFSCRGSLWL